ncbi:HD-GYP domain-containing protein [Bacillus thuringiensis]|uniref:HD-GYP domain-containing protein n=1 Tax=Bacillus thuringiensis TaxID=1428 RepID=UPI0034C6136F
MLDTTSYLEKMSTKGLKLKRKENLELLLKTLELKDVYTFRHSERVAKFATILAKETSKFTDAALKRFYIGCLLHDIGKIKIPHKILNKSSFLTNKEYQIIKNHPLIGIELIKSHPLVGGWIAGYEDIIFSHHEKWDGSGYPKGLKKEEIPLNARIVAIADAFDAMTSNRAYRNALSFEEAYEKIINGADAQFDSVLVEVFKKFYPLWIKVLNPNVDK